MADREFQMQQILVATDFSEAASAALQQALLLADKTRAEVTLAHAVDYQPYAFYGSSFEAPWQIAYEEIQEVEKQLRRQADEKLAQYAAPLKTPSRTLRTLTLSGIPFVELILEAQRQPYDLVIVGTRGSSAVKRLLVGSTAERLVRKSPCPVWVVKPHHESLPRSILVPIDFSEVSGKSLQFAAFLAGIFGSTVTALHVIGSPDELIAPAGSDWKSNKQHRQKVRQAATQHLHNFVRERVPAHLDVQEQLALGEPWQKISLAARHIEADLIVMGSVGRSGIPGFLIGNTAEKVLRHCDHSILTLKPDDFVSPIQPVGADAAE